MAAEKEVVKVKEHKSGKWSPELSESEKETIYAIAKDTLEWCVAPRGKTPFAFDKYTITDKLKLPTHSFVTLKIGEELRGCIGSLPPWSAEPMYLSVHQNAVSAALKDGRFRPVSVSELQEIKIHVSLLSPATDIATPEEFKIGEHGIIVEMNGRRGVFLPEVAVEQNWTREETLSYLCEHKAFLPVDAWKKGAKLRVFSSVVLSIE